MEFKDNMFVAMLVVIVVASGIGIGFVATHGGNSTAATSSNQPYDLTLVITTQNYFNSTIGTQPAYFVLQNGVPTSSANISIPAYRLIKLTIINYDDGSAGVAPQYANVSGTVNNQVTVLNDSMVNATQTSQININGSRTASAVPVNDIAHTFTISKLNFNIPVQVSSVTTAFVYFNTTGSYQWQCMAACGSGSTGWAGAMDTPGWMAGIVTIAA